MKVFRFLEIYEALAHSASNRQALHLHCVVFDSSPRCFRDAVIRRKEPIAHLYDLDTDRLVKKAKRLGVKVIYIDGKRGYDRHIDLCGAPLVRCVRDHLQKLIIRRPGMVESIITYLRDNWPGTRNWSLL